MKMTVTVRGGEALAKRLKSFPELIGRETESLLKQEARALAVELAKTATLPFGFDEPVARRNRVGKEVRQVFGSFERPHQVFVAIQRQNRGAAAGFMEAYKAGDRARMARIAAKFGIVPGITFATHKSTRTSPRASVPKNQHPIRLDKEAQVERFTLERMRLVGLAKAGWYVAAKSLGGRIRRNLVDSVTGKRSTEEIFPAYLRKLARVGLLGTSSFTGSGMKMRLTMTNQVRYAEEAVDAALMETAVAKARANFVKALQDSLRWVLRGGKRNAA